MTQEEANKICGESALWHKFVIYLARNHFPSVPVDPKIRMAFAQMIIEMKPKHYDFLPPKNFISPMGKK